MTQNNSHQSQSLDDDNVQEKLKELEAQVYATTKESASPETQTSSSFMEQINGGIKTIRRWFDALPQVGKLIVGVLAILAGFSVLNFFLHLITSLISVAILSLILYGLYRYLFSSSQSK